MARDIVIENRATTLNGRDSLLAALGVGAFVGFFGWLLTLAVNSWVLRPIFCRSADTAAACVNADVTAWVIAHIVISIIGLFLLIRLGVFRPLLVVLAAVVTLWTVGLWFFPLAWWVGLLWETGLFALAYALYKWVASYERFLVATIVVVVLVVVMRILIAA